MTLSIASVFPPEKIAGFSYAGMPFPYPKGIAFCSDSRLSYGDSTRADTGNKVFQIVKGIGLVYAGNTRIAEITIPKLSSCVRSHHIRSHLDKMVRVFSNTFKKTYHDVDSRTQRGHKPTLNTAFLVGFYNFASHDVHLIEFRSPHFIAIGRNGIAAIGSTENVRNSLYDHVEELVRKQHSYPGSVNDLAALFGVALQHVIDSNHDPSIGGVPEIAIIDSKGTHPLSHVVLDEDLNRVYEVTREDEGWVKKTDDGEVHVKTRYPPYEA